MRKSYFSSSIFVTWLRRYWGGAALMGLVYLLAALIYGGNMSSAFRMGYIGEITPDQAAMFISAPMVSNLLALFTAGAGLVASMLCFHYLHDGKAAAMLHSLPPRREAMFLSVSAAGLTLLGVPILLSGIMFGIGMAAVGMFALWPVALYVLIMLSIALLSFALGAFAAMLTGRTIVQGVLGVLVVNLPLMLEMVISSYCSQFLFGYVAKEPITARINPLYAMTVYLTDLAGDITVGNAVSAGTPLMFLLAGLVCMALALLLYRSRRLEASGDVIAVKAMRPVFRYGMALLSAVIIGRLFSNALGIGYSFVAEVAFALFGGAIGYYVAEMLLRRKLKVFRYFKGFLPFAAVYLALLCTLHFDVMGYGGRQLNAADVEYIAIGGIGERVTDAMEGNALQWHYTVDDLDIEDEDGYIMKAQSGDMSPMPQSIAVQILAKDNTVYSGEEMQASIQLQNMIAGRAEELKSTSSDYYGNFYDEGTDSYYFAIPVLAKMKDGSVFRRTYCFSLPAAQVGELLEQYQVVAEQNTAARVQNTVNLGRKANRVTLWFYYHGEVQTPYVDYTLNRGEWDGLLEAYAEDMQARAEKGVHSEAYQMLQIEVQPEGHANVEVLYVYLDCEKTLAWLVEHGYLTQENIEQMKKVQQRLIEDYGKEIVLPTI